MDLRLRTKLKALPIWDPADFSVRSAIADFMTISEQSTTGAGTIEAALDEVSDAQLDEYGHPQTIASTSRARAFLAEKGAQSSQYHWKRRGDCLVLLAGSRFAESLDVPGVAFEFVVRTGRSAWTVYRIPDPGEILSYAVYLVRNELIIRSRRPSKSPIRAVREKPQNALAKLGRAIAMALSPLPIREGSLRRCKESGRVAVSGVLPS